MKGSAMPWLADMTPSTFDGLWMAALLLVVFLGFLAVGHIVGPRRPKKVEADPGHWYCEYARGPGEEV